MTLMRKRIPRSVATAGKTSPLPASPLSGKSSVSRIPRGGFCAVPFCRTCPPPPSPLDSMYCGVVASSSSSTFEGTTSSDDSDTEVLSLSDSSFSDSTSGSVEGKVLQVRAGADSLGQWKENLLKASNFASLLCVLDCTILPVVTIVFPLFGIVAASPAQMEWLHELGHAVALGFVMPVGGLATFMNYFYAHRTPWIASLGVLGLSLVFGANAGCSLIGHGTGGAVGHVLHEALHWLHHGIQHRLANLTGCALLLFSNWLSHRRQHAAGTCSHGPSCSHNHHGNSSDE